jgi:probable phosphoglycerate mutase
MSTHPLPSQIVAHIDGASRGNPGPAAYGVVLQTEDGRTLKALSKNLGQATNNVAEYHALLAALEFALEHHVPRLKVFSDSELLVRQVQGYYKVKSADLRPLHERARNAIAPLEAFSIQHVPRAENREADRLANLALDGAEKKSKKESTQPPGGEPLRTRATYREGVLNVQQQLPLTEGEEVEIEIRRKK